MSVVDLWNVLALLGGAWLIASCVAMVALLSIHDAERGRPAALMLDGPQGDVEAPLGPPSVDGLGLSPGAANSAAGRP